MTSITNTDINKHLGLVKYVVRKWNKGRLSSEDLHSIALQSLVKAYNSYNSSRGGFANYAVIIMTRDIIEAFRKLNKDNRGMIDSQGDYSHEEFLDNSTQHTPNLDAEIDMDRFLNSLEGRTKDMMIMHYVGGYELQEIGDKYNLTASRVHQILSRAVSDLQGLI